MPGIFHRRLFFQVEIDTTNVLQRLLLRISIGTTKQFYCRKTRYAQYHSDGRKLSGKIISAIVCIPGTRISSVLAWNFQKSETSRVTTRGGVGVSPPVWHVRRTRGTRINDDDVQKYVRPTAGARAREESSSFPAEPRFYRVRSRGNRDGRRQSPKTYYIIVVLYTYIVSTYTSILLLLPRDANGIAGLLSAGRAPDNIGFLRRNPDVKNDRWTTMPAGISARPPV